MPEAIKTFKPLLLSFLLLGTGCSLLEELPQQPPLGSVPPETYLSIQATQSLYAQVDTIVCVEPVGGGTAICDTTWNYFFEADSIILGGEIDTINNALQTILASQQLLHWWGEDSDGDIIGYYYKWNTDSTWTFTTDESREFIIPIRIKFDVFEFKVYSMDNDSLVDATPASIVLPIRNSPPEIAFRFRSNPIVADANVVHRTYPTRTFVWDFSDADGLETVDSIYYALDDTSAASWVALHAAAYSSVSLKDIAPGFHTFYLRAKDIAGAESPIIQYPDTSDESTPNTWEVLPVIGDVLIVDDYPLDSDNNALNWYRGIFDTIATIGANNYSVWEIGRELPYSESDVLATLSYFKSAYWYAAYTGIETYGDASNAINSYVLGGGNLFLNVTELRDTSFIYFPLDSLYTINPDGLLLTGRRINSQFGDNLDLVTSRLIAVRLRAFELFDTGQFDPVKGPNYAVLYRLQLPQDDDAWTGEPIIAAEYDHRSEDAPNAGKLIFMTVPLHNGSTPVLEGEGTAGKLISWVFATRFGP